MPSYGPLQRRSQEDAYKWVRERKRGRWRGEGCSNGRRQSRNNPYSLSNPAILISPSRFSIVPAFGGYNIFEKRRNSPLSTEIIRVVYFRAQSRLALASFLHLRFLPRPSLAILIVFEGRKNTGRGPKTPWFIDAPRSTRGPIITKVINNLRCLSGAWEYTSFDIPIVIRYYLRSPHRTGEQLTIVTLRSIVIIIVGDQAQADV